MSKLKRFWIGLLTWCVMMNVVTLVALAIAAVAAAIAVTTNGLTAPYAWKNWCDVRGLFADSLALSGAVVLAGLVLGLVTVKEFE